MSIRSLESEIVREARKYFCNSRLRVKDLMEWSTGDVKQNDGEVIGRLPMGVSVAILKENDKRKTTQGGAL
ncbi:hypothetical protein CrLKS3_g30 [Cylindrospermopsis phage Cr-LKS3]|nr:hypothetical protein CrLKS3_g30 [Cylindrospermopsis phage Cr-LKS3]